MSLKVCITFDDGRDDNYKNAYEILKKYNLTATFFVTTGFIDKTWKKPSEWESANCPLTKEELLEMSNTCEIGSHMDTHTYNLSEVAVSIEKLKYWGINSIETLSIPNSLLSDDEIMSDYIILEQLGIKYVRTSRKKVCYTFINKVKYLLNRIFSLPFLYYSFNIHNIETDSSFVKHSIVIKNTDSAENLIKFIKKCENKIKEGTIILMFHSILKKSDSGYGKDKWYWDYEKFLKLCEFLKNDGNVEVIMFKEC